MRKGKEYGGIATRARLERREAGNEATLTAGPDKLSHSYPLPP